MVQPGHKPAERPLKRRIIQTDQYAVLVGKKVHPHHVGGFCPFGGAVVVRKVPLAVKQDFNQYRNGKTYSDGNKENGIRLTEQIRDMLMEPEIPYGIHPRPIDRLPAGPGHQRRTEKRVVLYQLRQLLRRFPRPDIYTGHQNQKNQVKHRAYLLPSVTVYIHILIDKYVELVPRTNPYVRFLRLGSPFRKPVG